MAEQEPRVEKVKLRDIVPNPFGDIPLNEEAVEQLATQFKSRHYHNHIVGRRRPDGKVEIAYGHHRKAALEEVHGKGHEIEVEVSDLTDEDMIKELAGDNDFSFKLTPRKFDAVVRAARNILQAHPDKLRETLSSEIQDNSRERIRNGARAIAEFLHKKKISQVRLSLERVNAIDGGVVHADALYLMPNLYLADMFIGFMKKRPELDKKYHVPIARYIIRHHVRSRNDMKYAFYNACRQLEKEGLVYFDPDYEYNTTFKSLAGKMNQLQRTLFYLPSEFDSFMSKDNKRLAGSIRFKDLSTFRTRLIGLGNQLAGIREYIESKVPADVWTQEEVKPTKTDYVALLARLERKKGKNVVLKTGELLKYFGLHKKASEPWGIYYLWQVKKMIKEGKLYYKPDKKEKQDKPQVASKAKQKKSRSRSSH